MKNDDFYRAEKRKLQKRRAWSQAQKKQKSSQKHAYKSKEYTPFLGAISSSNLRRKL